MYITYMYVYVENIVYIGSVLPTVLGTHGSLGMQPTNKNV